MAGLFELGQLLTAAQGVGASCVLSNGQPGPHCPAHALHAITAAMATQGYWVQADLLYFLEYTNFQSWAVLIYIFAFAGAIFGMALGAPPKMWIWLVMGPGIFHWLIADTVPMKGVRWNTGPIVGNDGGFNSQLAQREVWKLAEVGLLNTNIVKRGAVTVSADSEPSGGAGIGINNDGSVQVSQIFSYYDTLLSDLVDWVISWTGLYTLSPSNSNSGSNVPSIEMHSTTKKGPGGSIDNQNWLLSNLKWTMLEDITGAKISSPDLRDSFATFFASECGDAFSKGIDEAAFVAAHNSKGITAPDTIFLRDKPSLTALLSGGEYGQLTQNLISQTIPTPPSLRKFLDKSGPGSFRESIQFLKNPDLVMESGVLEQIRCDQYLYLLMHALRWESGHIYYQLASRLPGGFNPSSLHYAMMYGWAVKKEENISLGLGSAFLDNSQLLRLFGGSNAVSSKVDLDPIQSMRFFQNLVLVHLWRNEMAIVPRMQVRRSSGEETVNYVESYQKTVGARSKFGEVYSWAMLMPRLQGILLYFLAMAYPFCAMLVLIPGWHKILFTWLSFWTWVKIWDIGFAIVFVIERSMWAMIGNSPEAQRLFSKVLLMDSVNSADGSHIDITCSPQGVASIVGGLMAPLPNGICQPGVVPVVSTAGTMSGIGAVTGGLSGIGVGGSLSSFGQFERWWNSLRTMDRSMTIGASMKLDLENSYYIYIMSALYFAVPAVTGQLVLGAKAGAASLATGAIGNLAGESGRAAGQGSGGDLSQRARANQAAVGQAAYAKDMRNQAAAGGFAAKAMDQGNQRMVASAQAAFNQTANGGEGQLSKFGSHNLQSDMNALNAGAAGINAHFAKVGGMYDVARMNGQLPRAQQAGDTTRAAPSAAGAAPSGVGAPAGTGAAQSSTNGGSGINPFNNIPGLKGWMNDPNAVSNWNRVSGTVDGLRQNGAATLGLFNSAGKAAWDQSMAETQAGLQEGNIRQQAQHDAFQGQAGVNSFGFGQQAAGFEASSGKNAAAADYSAKSAQYDAERNMASSLGGQLAVEGAPGVLSIGPKPVGMEPMAMVGQLGKGMQQKAGFAETGFQQFVKAGQDKLQGVYGYQAMMSQFRPGDGAALMQRVVNGASDNQGRWLGNPTQKMENVAQQQVQQRFGADGTMKPEDLRSSKSGPAPKSPPHPNSGLIPGM
jgi:hypothetical protein